MTHVPFASRIASFIGIPSTPTQKRDENDDYYIPYTGTYEPPPASSSHPYSHTRAHASSTNPAPSNYTVTSGHPHPYNPDRLVYLPDPTTPVDESDRGRRRKTRPLSGTSSLAALSPSTESSGNIFPRTPSVNQQVHPRRGGSSYLALDSGFIGQSPVAVVPPREAGREAGGPRSSFASFITFGNSRKSIGGSSGSTGGPLSAQGLTFPHGTSKLRGELRLGRDDEEASALAPPLPPYLRPRSKSYQDETSQGVTIRNRQEEGLHKQGHDPIGNTRGSVRVMMPSSFFDTTPFTEPNTELARHPHPPTSRMVPQISHPYHQHYQHSLDPPAPAFDLTSPVTPSFDFLHPYANASGSGAYSAPVQPSRNVRPIVIPPKLGLDVGDRERERAPHSAFPFINPFSSKSRPSSPSRPATPKGRLKALISLGEGLRTLKGSTSTPNLRIASKGQQSNAPGVSDGTQMNQSGRRGTVANGVSRVPEISSTGMLHNAVLQGQTFCDTFFLPRPRFQAHPISPPDTPYNSAQHPTRLRQEATVLVGGGRDWETGRRATATAIVEGVDATIERRGQELLEAKRLGKKKVSAPDLRKKPERPSLADMRTMTETEKVIQLGVESLKEREEWASEGRKSFQNKRSRSLSRSRTKSVAKAATIATGGQVPDDTKLPPTTGDVPPGGGIVSITNSKSAHGSAPPTATTSSGDDSKTRERRKEGKGLDVKGSMEYLAAKAFSQGHNTTLSISSHSHSRQHSADVREKEHDGVRGHRRSESWGRSALKRAKTICVDVEATSPAVERVFEAGEPLPPLSRPLIDNPILDIAPSKHAARVKEPASDTDSPPSKVGIAIGTPPLDTLVETTTARIEHPYSSPLGSPVPRFAGPHPVSPILLPMVNLSDVVSRHRLPPRAAVPVSPSVSPSIKSNGLADLDVFVPTIETSHQAMLSRESWLIYMNAMEEAAERPRTADKGKGRVIEPTAPEQLHRMHPERVDETQLTKAFRHQSTGSLADSSENEHASLTFEAGTTLTRLLSSRSVTATPRPGLGRALSNSETPREKKVVLEEEDPERTLTRTTSTRPPIPIFAPDVFTAPRSPPSGNGGKRPSSGYSEGLTISEHHSLWRKSTVSSEGHPHSPSSHESSPKASPRAMVNLDDLEGYSDLFYHSGAGNTGGRPKSGSSSHSGGLLLDRGSRPGVVTFGLKGSSSLIERSHSSPDSTWGRAYNAPMLKAPGIDPAWRMSGDMTSTWDPEEEEDSYRIVSSRPPIMPIAVVPIHRHSTKLSVIEGSIDEHATASESTGERDSLPALSPLSPTRPSMEPPEGAFTSSGTLPHLEKLSIPSYARHRTSSEAAVAGDGQARISMMTSTSGQSRMSGLSEFPIPPMESTSLALTPSNVLQAYFPPRQASPDVGALSPVSVEPPSSVGDGEEQEEMSVSEHHHVITAAPRSYNSNRATFGPESEMAMEWTDRLSAGTPPIEDN